MADEKQKEEKGTEPEAPPKDETAVPVEKEEEPGTSKEVNEKEPVQEVKTPEPKAEPAPEKEDDKVPQKEDVKAPKKEEDNVPKDEDVKAPEKADSDDADSVEADSVEADSVESVAVSDGPAPEEKAKPEKTTPAKDAKTPEVEPKKAEEKPKSPKKALPIPAGTLLLFGKYDVSEVEVHDAGLARYINLDPVSVPHSGAKHANRPFAKGKVHVVERLVNNLMRTEKVTGKKTKTYKAVMRAFEIIRAKTKKNPIQVLIDAIENSTPREEVTRLRYGGVSVPKAVDTSSSRRLDISLRNICKGTVAATHKNTTPIEVCLANEIMLAAKGDMNSFAVSKKDESERVAGSAR